MCAPRWQLAVRCKQCCIEAMTKPAELCKLIDTMWQRGIVDEPAHMCRLSSRRGSQACWSSLPCASQSKWAQQLPRCRRLLHRATVQSQTSTGSWAVPVQTPQSTTRLIPAHCCPDGTSSLVQNAGKQLLDPAIHYTHSSWVEQHQPLAVSCDGQTSGHRHFCRVYWSGDGHSQDHMHGQHDLMHR